MRSQSSARQTKIFVVRPCQNARKERIWAHYFYADHFHRPNCPPCLYIGAPPLLTLAPLFLTLLSRHSTGGGRQSGLTPRPCRPPLRALPASSPARAGAVPRRQRRPQQPALELLAVPAEEAVVSRAGAPGPTGGGGRGGRSP
jgi:hypothetical protein